MIHQKIVYLVASDEAPKLDVRFTDRDLADFSSVIMRIEYEDGSRASKVVTAVGVSDPELGQVDWDSGDLIAGEHRAEFELIQSDDGKKLTLPKRFSVILKIREDLG